MEMAKQFLNKNHSSSSAAIMDFFWKNALMITYCCFFIKAFEKNLRMGPSSESTSLIT